MWRNHRSIYQDHLKYVRNDIVKPLHAGILRYVDRVLEMNDLAEYLPSPSMKGECYGKDNWKFHDQEFTVSDIHVAIKDGLTSYMQDELEDHQEDYRSLTN